MEASVPVIEQSLLQRALHNRVLSIGATALASGLLALSAIGQHDNPPSQAQLRHDTPTERFIDKHGDEAAGISSGLMAYATIMQGAALLIRRRRSNS